MKKNLKKAWDIIVEYWWTIGTALVATGMTLVLIVARIAQSRQIAIPGAVVFGVGFLMLIVPLVVDLIGSMFDRY